MATMFQIGSASSGDYSNRVIAGSYAVQKEDIYTTWTDANGRVHRSIYRSKTSGQFSMLFKSIAEFNTFCQLIKNTQANDSSVRCTVFDNLGNQTVTSDFYISFTPTRDRDNMWNDKVDKITVKIEEA